METKLIIQDSFQADCSVLYDSIIQGCKDSNIGGGAFAFVSSAGVELLFNAPEFQDLIKQGEFTLVVGMDAITNTATIDRLSELETLYQKLSIFAFINERTNLIFHPKLIWFSGMAEAKLIVGSGNLTLAGLRFNYEAYTESSINNQDFSSVKKAWDSWLTNNKQYLHKITEEIVLEKAKENDRTQIALKKIKKLRKRELSKEELDLPVNVPTTQDDIDDEWTFDENAHVLVAEVPRSGGRWHQINFDKKTYENFFGANINTSSKFILLRSISEQGILGDIERRPNVTVVSHNYRFEFGAATGDYPLIGRPLLVVAKLGIATFLYEIFLPGDSFHEDVEKLLLDLKTNNTNNLQRVVFTAQDLEQKLPSLPIFSKISSELIIAY